jgi:hypothetical protein
LKHGLQLRGKDIWKKIFRQELHEFIASGDGLRARPAAASRMAGSRKPWANAGATFFRAYDASCGSLPLEIR